MVSKKSTAIQMSLTVRYSEENLTGLSLLSVITTRSPALAKPEAISFLSLRGRLRRPKQSRYSSSERSESRSPLLFDLVEKFTSE